VKIDIHEQLYRWRQDLTEQKQTPFVKRFVMNMAGFVLAENNLYNMAGRLARQAIRYLPHGLLYLPVNAWGKGRELPAPPKQSFKEWYIKNKKGKKS
jgi:L-lactate dehydrogenase complex protein LldF